MDNKMLKKRRMWGYFVDAAITIIQEEGFQALTIRKVAQRAGYNSATMYNYFRDLSHLRFFASMKLLNPYVTTVSQSIANETDPLEKYRIAWDVFCRFSTKQPELFHAVFIMDLGEHPDPLISEYYEAFPADIVEVPEELKVVLFKRNIMNRGSSMLQEVVEAGIMTAQQADEINYMTIMMWKGMLTDLLYNRSIDTPEEAYVKLTHHIDVLLAPYRTKCRHFDDA